MQRSNDNAQRQGTGGTQPHAVDALSGGAEATGEQAEPAAAAESPALGAASPGALAFTASAPRPAAGSDASCDALSATPSPSSPLPFGSFLSTVRSSGLRLLRTLDAPTLLRFAEQSLVLEEEVATGCLMIQGIALLEHFHRTNGINPLDWPEQATRTGQWVDAKRMPRHAPDCST